MTTRELTCREVLAAVSDFLDGDLDADRCAAIERHCAGCPACAEVVGGLRSTVSLCRHAAQEALPDAVRARARAQVRRLLDADRT